MVGVPGKFKGCETCRRRRVPCDNERPFCRKCTKNGHDCEGYERPIMFITGTLEDKGRVSIHPKKPFSASAGVKKVRKPASPPRASPRLPAHTPTPTTPTATTLLPSPALSQPQSLPLLLRASPRRTGFGRGRLDIILAEPLTPAWDDILFLASRGAERIVRLAAMYARLDSVSKTESAADSGDFTVALPPYYPPDIHPRWQEGGGDFEVGSQCLLHLAPPLSPGGGGEHSAAPAAVATPSTSICLFLFEQNSSMVQDNTMAPWKIPQSQLGSVRKLGPEYFRRFPNHHYFVRVFRPSAVMMAFMSRKDTFLCSAEWKTVPWEAHPKSIFDSLLDIVSFLPSIFGRTDRMMPAQPTLSRRLRAQDLLASCLSVEKQFDDWFVLASQGPTEDTYSYWIQEPSQTETRLPFADSFAFRDGILAVAFLYYWTAQIQFHQCIEALHRLIFQPVVVDDYHPHPHHHPHHPHHHPAAAASYPPDLPPNLLINPVKYQQGREFAANICRALNFALSSTVQPDLLVAPLTVATDLYSQIHEASGGDGALELMWCDTLRGRLITKAEDMASVIQTKTWFELSRY